MMKKLILVAIGIFGLMSFTNAPKSDLRIEHSKKMDEKITIKIKNDTGDDVKVMNAGSGGSYSLTKGATTPIKMEVGDKLYHYNSGKKGALILTASADMDGKVQLLSKL